MVNFHRLNPNAMLVLLGTVIYVVVGGPSIVVGGVSIALVLGALHRPGGVRSSGDGPTSLFGTYATVSAPRRAVRPDPFLRAVPVIG